ncbi:hypothetical protein HMPREF0620_0977 [Parascardovia denticolens DSM 10105 = JCM 12538]|uniref:Uncharacterized protein n=1 Tax=Parascardovia denticolens DSM 10105 = JCM 12538 TaxID=864564 RepID=E6JZ82_PARDN|nr:hypothetical protein HMPREF0620_0977 [Parascardovia denticolens DSM 10105 = JCM 12538]BAR05185.1 hypothetical protein PSDT_0666 [Parascardovia denticolens DSM 10105 = JCM 12538]
MFADDDSISSLLRLLVPGRDGKEKKAESLLNHPNRKHGFQRPPKASPSQATNA